MGKCFITKLNESTNNSILKRIGEIRVKFNKVTSPTFASQGFNINPSKNTKLEIIGDGYFTDKNLLENKGKNLEIDINDIKRIYVSNGDFELAILDKYNLVNVGFDANNSSSSNKSIDINDFKYSKGLKYLAILNEKVSGNIEALKEHSNIETLIITNSPDLTGNIKNLTNMLKLKSLSFSNTSIEGDVASLVLLKASSIGLSNTKFSGDIGNITETNKIKQLDISNTSIYGNISGFSNIISLVKLSASNLRTPLVGNIDSLNALNYLEEISLQYSSLSGDLAQLPSTCRFASFNSSINTNFTWGNRDSSAKIIAIEGKVTINNIDKLLQDQAKCQIGFKDNDSIWYKTINLYGTRTSASDAAVQTLQSKGYTVSITPA